MTEKLNQNKIAVGIFALIAGLLMALALATSNSGSFEAELATLENAQEVELASASDGRFIEFGDGNSGQVDDSDKPNASTVGPRIEITRDLTQAEALAELRQTGYLSGVRITNGIIFSGSDGVDWVIEDSIIQGGGFYTVNSYFSNTQPFTGSRDQRPILRHVDLIGQPAINGSGSGGSAVVAGGNIVIEHADVYGAQDGVKARSNLSLINSWVHDMDHPFEAHADNIQIRAGTGILIEGNRLDGYVGYTDGTTSIGEPISGVLQTGSVFADIEATWLNNWFAGGGWTIRGAGSREAAFNVDYTFKNNKWMRTGTSIQANSTTLTPHRFGPVTGDVGDFDDSNVWEDTGLPVR